MDIIITESFGNRRRMKHVCLYEENNPYDHFAIKTLSSDGKIVGHLPREISRVTKFFLDHGANISVKLTSRHYRRSPFVQGGMEIACLVRQRSLQP